MYSPKWKGYPKINRNRIVRSEQFQNIHRFAQFEWNTIMAGHTQNIIAYK